MSISEPFIRRPVATTLVMMGILIFGIIGYQFLPVSELPNVDYPSIEVSVSFPGASPETMAASVATPLERQFSTIAGLDSMSSVSALGTTRITLQFSLDRNIDGAAQDVQTAIATAQRLLPSDLPNPPSYRKVNPADQPILVLSLSSSILPLSTVNEYADTIMAQRISMIGGVAQVMIYGAQKYAVRVRVNPRALHAKGISFDDVRKAVEKANVNIPTGTIYGKDQAFTVQATGQLYNAEAYKPLIVAYRKGSPVRLQEVGTAVDSVENDKIAAWYNTPESEKRSITLAVQRQPGTNTVEVAAAIKALLPSFRAQIPASIDLNILYDRSESIHDSIQDVKFSLYLSLCLVVLVIFLFLRNVSATIIPSLALPLSIVGTFGAMYMLGYSLDNLSLMALTLSVGFVVDDAIVMLENIVRHMEMGKNRLQASLDGAREIGFTIVSMTISLAAVFIPLFFMGGMLGRLLHEFAVTIAVAVLVSGFVSLTLSPMLCSRFLAQPGTAEHGRLYAVTERFFDGMLGGYELTLKWVLARRRVVIFLSIFLLAATGYLFWAVPKDFIPSQDTGQVMGFSEAAQGISFEGMAQHQRAVAAIIREDPNVAAFVSTAGATGGSPTGNSGRLMMRLKPRADRKMTADQAVQSLRSKLSSIPGINVFLQNPPAIQIGARMTKSQYQYTLQGADIKELFQWAPALEEKFRSLPAILDVTSDLQISNPQIMVNIERDKALALGISADEIENTLYSAYGARQVSTIYTPTNQYQVILEVLPEYQLDPASLEMLYLQSSSGRLVPSESVVELTRNVGPLTVNHTGQLASVTISFNLKPGVALGEAVNQIEGGIRELRFPATLTGSFQGAAQQYQASLKGMWILLILAILVIYMVLGMLYESFVHPLTILSGLPSAAVGALLTLLIFRTDLSIYAFVGIIMLVGIVKKNAIMMIDFALSAQREQGKSPAEAIYDGCILRFRPIMMTTMAALMGTLPIALGFGAGAEARRPLGLAVVGGLVLSQLLTLYITPVVYIYMEALVARLRGIGSSRRSEFDKRQPDAAILADAPNVAWNCPQDVEVRREYR